VAVRSIITFENPRLRKKSIKIKRVDAELQTLIDDMIDTMRAAEGIGLAAPQVGVLLRVIVAEYVDEDEELQQTVLINPEITAREGEWMAEEGCLSLPDVNVNIRRAVSCSLRGQDLQGRPMSLTAMDLLARCWQHEVDHLDGIEFVDRMTSMQSLTTVRNYLAFKRDEPR
jgi:peptide deformylase